jgi:hypothetical protein
MSTSTEFAKFKAHWALRRDRLVEDGRDLVGPPGGLDQRLGRSVSGSTKAQAELVLNQVQDAAVNAVVDVAGRFGRDGQWVVTSCTNRPIVLIARLLSGVAFPATTKS